MKSRLFLVLSLVFFTFNVKAQCFTQVDFTYAETTNGTINFTSAISGGTMPYSYNWLFSYSGNVMSSDANPSLMFPANGDFWVCLTVVDANGCYDSACQIVKVMTAINPKCPGNGSFTTSSNNGQVDFLFNSPAWHSVDFGDSYYGYSYFDSSAFVQHNYSLNGNYTVRCIAYKSINGFRVPCDTFTNTITVTGIPCSADFTVYRDSALLMDTVRYYFYINPTLSGMSSHRIYINGVQYSDSLYLPAQFPPGKYTICLAAEGPGSCYDSICKIDSINYTPLCGNLNFNLSPLNCDNYQFTTINTGMPLTSIEWFIDGNLVSTQPNPAIQLDFSSKTVSEHTVKVTAKRAGCESSKSFRLSNPSLYTVGENYDTSGSIIYHTYYLYPDNSGNVASESWDFGDGTTSSLPYPTHTYSSAGTYTVCHLTTLTNGCSYQYCNTRYFNRMEEDNHQIKVVVVNPNGIPEDEISMPLRLYPNPASNYFFILNDKKFSGNEIFTLFNHLGQIVKTIPLRSGEQQLRVDIGSLSAWMYYFGIENNFTPLERGKIIFTK